MVRLLRLVLACLLVVGAAVIAIGAPAAVADPCVGSWSIGIGGLGDNYSSVFAGVVNQPVGYDSWNPPTGYWEIDRLFWLHRADCPGDHIKVMGHSEGAAIVHAWVSDHLWVDNANAVMLADPKLAPGPGGGGIAQWGGFLGWPLAGVDANFDGFPALEVCRWDDGVCNVSAGPSGYVQGHHGWYDFAPWDYGDWDAGVWMQ